ncbi:MAG: Holliday junction branch migration protein RuvA [Lachnospiraceae bacterium]|nr:Holliday junction branch migration protein RuvA [Lachnospiraceae bacterium]
MYAFFKGTVESIYSDYLILDTGSMGVNIMMSASELDRISVSDEVKIYTYTSVREDAITLYGFLSREKLDFFKLLLTVNGVGPKLAIGIAGCNTEDVKTAIVAQDTKALSKLPGVGAKMAGRLALELKDKVSLFSSIDSDRDTVSTGVSDKNPGNTLISEAVSILTALGYSSSEALRAIRSVDISDDDTAESLVPKALRVL